MPPPIRFVYFDLDDTLLDHHTAQCSGLTDLFNTHRAAFGEVTLAQLQETYHKHNQVLWPLYANGSITRDELRRLRFELTMADLGVATLHPDDLNTLYLKCYADYWSFLPEASAAFHAVADRYPVGIITNGFTEVQRAKLNRFPELRERARAVLISEEVGYMKPHPKLFAHAEAYAAAPPEAILYIGDSLTSDVRGAQQAGWQMAWFCAHGHTEEERSQANGALCFSDWSVLLDHLGIA